MTEATGTTARFEIRLKPGASGTGVGGTWGDRGALNVAVPEKPIDGRANAAAIAILATVLRVKKHQLRIVRGQTHRTKVIEVTDPPDHFQERLDHWRNR